MAIPNQSNILMVSWYQCFVPMSRSVGGIALHGCGFGYEVVNILGVGARGVVVSGNT